MLRGVQRTGGKLSYWTQITPTWEGYVEGGGAYLSDENGEVSLGGSVAWRPFRVIDAQIALALDAMHYEDFSPYYYSPEVDVGSTVSLMGRVPVWRAARARLRRRRRSRLLEGAERQPTSVPPIA